MLNHVYAVTPTIGCGEAAIRIGAHLEAAFDGTGAELSHDAGLVPSSCGELGLSARITFFGSNSVPRRAVRRR